MSTQKEDPAIAELTPKHLPAWVASRLPSDERVAGAMARPLWILAACALVVALRTTREVLVPLFLAALLTLVLSGVVEFLHRYRIPRGVSALVLLLLLGFGLGSAVDGIWEPAQQWVQNAPRVLKVIEHKIRPARAVVQRLNDLATRASALAGAVPEAHAPATPTPGTPVNAMTVLTETGWIVGGIVTVAVLTLFLLAAGPPVLARMMATLVGNWHAAKVQSAIEAIRQDVGRYYGTLALINISLGLATAAAMWLLHMPNPILWGAMAAVLNFIPYLGSAVTLLVISVVALVTFDSTAQVLLVAGTYLALATIEGQIVEPIFFGRRLRLSPVVVFVALWLGGWLWGIAGVVFALPLLLAARVAATHAHGEGSVLARFLRSADGEAPPPPEEPPPSRVQVPTMLRARSPRR